MRWDNLKIEADDGETLPGYRDPARIRTFDAPEALDTRFYEVRAKSAINRVPKASQVPFSWTINPYRGCTHACLYCLAGWTPILMAGGGQRAIADLRVGDAIVGTVLDRNHRRRYVTTHVRDFWTTEKPVYRVTLADGTELESSGDHRFLTPNGWRHVAQGDGEHRPTLRVGSRLVGTGQFQFGPKTYKEGYQNGYLCGFASAMFGPESSPDISSLSHTTFYGIPIAGRIREYLLATSRNRDRSLVLAGVDEPVEFEYRDPIHDILRRPIEPTLSWRQGFLAGLYDECGSCERDRLTLTPEDASLVGLAHASLEMLGFDVTVEPSRYAGGKAVVVRGGLQAQLRFLHSVEPADARLRLDDQYVKSTTDTKVVSIEPLGETRRLYDITTGTGDFIANGVVSHNCFARPTHKYLDMDAGRDFEKQIIVKVNIPEVLRVDLARPSWKREHIAMGTNTDPYQWVEGRYKLMRGIWEAMRDFANPCSILTKSPLVLRDLDLLLEIQERTTVTANFSVPTLNEGAWRETEPHTPSPRARLEAVAELNRAGIPCGVLIAPLMPGINDDPREVAKIVELATEAGAVSIGGIALHLRGEVRFFDYLKDKRPDLVPEYERLYRRGAYAPPEIRRRLTALIGPGPLRQSRYMRDVEARRAELRADELSRREPEPLPQASLF
jgi:DNA repair photolyase